MPRNSAVTILKNDFPRLGNVAPLQADTVLRALSTEGVTEAKMSMTLSPATGREYTRRRSRHIASSPGNPPRVDTGLLRASIHFTKIKVLHYEIRDGVPYGIFLELGTVRMGARPFMIPMALHLQRRAPELFKGFLKVT